MDLTMKYQDRSGAWKDFDMADLMDEPARHSVLMFSRTNIPVVVRQGAAYIVNTEDLKQRYRNAGKKVWMFSTILTSPGDVSLDKPLAVRGFISS